eukprot:Phypoly_transcript_07674.p1 GENE.Phypoly_transcript_07674~~Phypoly_transcript_07674.p1  ORF type:complete len:491 (+),score=77.86 Phypoly_transcript_07674:33-1505(+)
MWSELGVALLVVLLIAYILKKAPPAVNSSTTKSKSDSIAIAVPSPTTFDPVMGNLPELAKAGSLHEYLTLLHNQFGPMAGFRYFDKFVVSLASPELFKQTNRLFNRPVPLFALFKPLIGDLSLQYANDEDAKNRRKLLDPFFAHSSVKNVFPVFMEAANKCTSNWEEDMQASESIEINLHNDMFNIAIYAIAKSAFGSEMSDTDMRILREAYDHCWNEMEKSIKGSPIEPGSPREKLFFEKRDVMFGLVQNMLDKAEKEQKIDPTEDGAVQKGIGGFVEFMLRQKSFSNDQIKCDTVTFLIGGFHTTGNFLIWTLYFLAKHPEYQAKVREEITEILKGGSPTFEAVCGMPFTTAVLNETLRYVALAPFAGRYSNEDEKIGEVLVPKGTMMVQALGVVLQSEKYWDKPDVFSPERFLISESTSQWGFRPFGVGNRMCPASKYAMLEAKAVIASLIPKFKFELLAGTQTVKAEYGLVGQMCEELHMKVSFSN